MSDSSSNASVSGSLELGPPPGRLQQNASKFPVALLWGLILLQAATIGILFVRSKEGKEQTSAVDAQELRAVAIALEDRSLHGAAATSWEQYLTLNAAEDTAELRYRIGRLHFKNENYRAAVTSFLHAEQHQPDDTLQRKIAEQMVACLGRLERYGEVDRELSRRVETGGQDTTQGRVLAQLDGEDLTEADLDRMVEQRVDQMLSLQRADPTARAGLLQQFQQPEIRQRLLQELLQQELFLRRARELKLDKTPEFVRALNATADSLLVSQFVAEELDKIQPTAVDLESYFKANQESYRRPALHQLSFTEVGDEENWDDILAQNDTAEKLRAWIRERKAAENKLVTKLEETVNRVTPHPVLGDVSTLLTLDADAWTTEPHLNEGRKFFVIVDVHTPPQLPKFADVESQVRQQYIAVKREELSQRLSTELMARYNVKLTPAPVGPPAPQPSEED